MKTLKIFNKVDLCEVRNSGRHAYLKGVSVSDNHYIDTFRSFSEQGKAAEAEEHKVIMDAWAGGWFSAQEGVLISDNGDGSYSAKSDSIDLRKVLS